MICNNLPLINLIFTHSSSYRFQLRQCLTNSALAISDANMDNNDGVGTWTSVSSSETYRPNKYAPTGRCRGRRSPCRRKSSSYCVFSSASLSAATERDKGEFALSSRIRGEPLRLAPSRTASSDHLRRKRRQGRLIRLRWSEGNEQDDGVGDVDHWIWCAHEATLQVLVCRILSWCRRKWSCGGGHCCGGNLTRLHAW
jgi:hypothetical protein